jgi:hypothetical protein
MLVLRSGAGRYGVELDRVLGVVEAVGLASGVPAAVQFRGREVPAVDARSLGWGGRGADGGPATALTAVIVGREGGPVALLVDAVEGLAAVDGVLAWPALLARVVPAVFRGVAMRPEGELLVVDPELLPGA